MKQSFLGIAAIALCAGAASAQVAQVVASGEARSYDIRTSRWSSGSIIERAGTTIYSNITNDTTNGLIHSTAGGVVGDDVTPVNLPMGGDIVSDVTISIANFSGLGGSNASPLTGVDLDVIFYSTGGGGVPGAIIGSFNFSGALDAPINPLSFALVTFSGLGSLPGLISVPDAEFLVGVRFNGATGPAATSLGQVFFGPPTDGSSASRYFRLPGVNPTNAPGTTNNFALEVQVPTPASLGLLAIGGLVAGRRRRN
ncbi:MAG TPA: hypothetical protein DEB06_09400 [Phycisphaerales bacterium]|nr:hypothetical protein [Phycisphaerales bacterium]